MFTRKACLSFISGVLLLAPLPASAAGKGLAPHKAIYDIKMTSRHSGAQVLNISGQMYFEGKATCEAWTTEHRFKLVYEYEDTPPMRITSNFSTYETMDGHDFSFTSRRERNGQLYEELRGHATLNDKGEGEAVYSLPDGLTFDLKPGIIFPTTHTETMLEQLKSNKKFFNAHVFDGSDQEGPVAINTFIGNLVDDITAMVPDALLFDKSLISSPAHKVRMAFFPLNKYEEEPDYEMDIILHDNGIISDMLVDYGSFSIAQDLVALEKLDMPVCDPGKSK